jgi:hypothetical protein
MKKLAGLMASLLLLTGCAQHTDVRVWEDGVSVRLYFVTDTSRGLKLVSEERTSSDYYD